jgi:hypothetical protein
MKLVVTRTDVISREAAEALPPIAQAQFFHAAWEAFRKKCTSPGEVFATIAEETGEDIEDVESPDAVGVCELTLFADADAPERPLYAFWVFLVDSGTLFPIDSAESTGIGMIQSFLEDERRTPEGKELAEAAQKAYFQSLRE